MNFDDDRLNRHLEQQAGAITLTPADAGEAMSRGRRRRTHRRVALTAVVAVAAVGVAALAVSPGGDESDVQSSLSATVAPTNLQWTVVAPHAGLGYGTDATLAGGALYSLSTAPGAGPVADGQHLYRSEDGTEWAEVSMPAGMSSRALSGSGDALYALGTAPAAGGGEAVVLATSTDDAGSWSNIALPSDVQDLDRRFPGEIQITTPVVVAQDASHVVAAIQVIATPDVTNQVPGYDPATQRLDTTPVGVDVYDSGYQACPDGCDPVAAGANADLAKRAENAAAKKVVAHYDWADLDVDSTLVDLIGGRTYVYATQDGHHFEASHLPTGIDGQGLEAVATADGYRLFVSSWNGKGAEATTHVLSSTDGRTFTESAAPLAGTVGSAGLLGDRPAVALWAVDGSSDVYVEQGGAWASLDLTQAATGQVTLGEVAFGPLGLAAILWEQDGDRSTPLIVHSADGSTVSPVPLAGAGLDPSHLGNVIGLAVTADGIFVRLGDAPDSDPATVPTQHVLVGTPA